MYEENYVTMLLHTGGILHTNSGVARIFLKGGLKYSVQSARKILGATPIN